MSKTNPVNELFEELSKTPDEAERNSLLESRGRACIGKNFIKKAKEAAKGGKSEEEIIGNLVDSIEMLTKEGDSLYITFPKCYCHHIKKFKGKIPDYYCNCSVGWIKELFRNALGKNVGVKVESTVLRGDSECRFEVSA